MRTRIPRLFIVTDRQWSPRLAQLNESLSATHPGWPVHFYDDAAALAFLKERHGERAVQAFHGFESGAHRADLFLSLIHI